MNYIKQLNGFFDSLLMNPLSATAQTLYVHLLDINNRCGWKERFPVANIVLQSRATLSRQQLDRARNELKQKGYIDYEKGSGNKAGIYLIVCFDTQLVTQRDTQDGTHDDTQSGHNACTYYKQKLKENSNNNYNSACAREYDPFLSDFDDIEVYYRQNINYSPTQRETQAISKWLSQTCKAGVMYAIDEAVDRGARNKSYISAVVDNLERNNVKTQADLTQFVERRRKRIQGGAECGITGTDTQEDGGGFDFSQVFKQPWERDDWEGG